MDPLPPRQYGEHAYSVITFRNLNARGEGDYFSGLRPTCPAEDDLAHDLGDPAEASLQAALHNIRVARCPDRAADAAAPNGQRLLTDRPAARPSVDFLLARVSAADQLRRAPPRARSSG